MTQPLRSVLYMPGSNARALEKARSLDCDAIILDLEDAVAPEAKSEARSLIAAALKEADYGHRTMVLRINAAGTEWHADDVAFAQTVPTNAVLIPKVNNAQDVVDARAAIPAVPLWAMMETPLAMLEAQAIAATGQDAGWGLSAFVMGTNDLAKDTGARLVPGREPMLAWLSTCVASAKAYGLRILDGVSNALDDPESFLAECEQGRNMGMDGKTLIHPKQIAACNEVFAPDESEIAFARAVIAAFDRPENQGKGALRLEGKMVERLHAEMAQRTVAMADAIARVKAH